MFELGQMGLLGGVGGAASLFVPLVADGVSATVDLNFTTNQGINGATRASAASLVTTTRAAPPALADDASGNWTAFGANVPRITNKGLLVEEARTQLVTNTIGAGMGIQNTGITSGQASPANDTTAMLVTDNSTNSTHYIYGTPPATVTTGTAYTVSAFFKNNGIRYVAVAFADGGALTNSFSANADLVAGVITQTNSTGTGSVSSSGIQVYANGWVRVWATGSSTTMTGAYTVMFLLPNGTTPPASATYVGSGQSTFVWCPQNEAGTFPTSPIPNTSGAAATRAADVVGLISSPAFGTSVSLFASGTPMAPTNYAQYQMTVELNNSSAAIVLQIGRDINDNVLSAYNGTNIYKAGTTVWQQATFGKAAVAQTAGSGSVVFNALAPGTDTTATWPPGTNPSSTLIGSATAGQFFDGYLARIAIWPSTRISNAGLQTLTAGATPSGVTFQAIDGESMTGPSTMTNNYYTRNGLTYAATAGFDNPSFYPLTCFYGIYSDVLTQFLDLGLNVSINMTSDTVTSILATNNIFGYTGALTTTTIENPTLTNNIVGLHVDEDDPTAFVAAMADSIQDGRILDVAHTFNQIVTGNVSGLNHSTGITIKQMLTVNQMVTPSSAHRSVDSYWVDMYWFSGSADTSSLGQFGDVLAIPMTYGAAAATADQAARGSNYGNMIDVMRSWGNGTNSGNGSSATGLSGAPSRIPLLVVVENKDGLIPGTPRLIQPPEWNWAVWSAIIHGARGIDSFTVAFNHNGGFSQTINSGQSISIYNQAKATHAQIISLASIINSPFALGYVTATPHGYQFPVYEQNWLNGGIEVMAKLNGHKLYIFATTRNSQTVVNQTATFTLADMAATQATVLYDSSTGTPTNKTITGGVFTDTFAHAWDVKVYRIESPISWG